MKAEWSNWKETKSREISSAEQAVLLLEELAQSVEIPAVVEIYCVNTGRSIGIGVGRSVSVVTYQDSLDPPYFISLGSSSGDDGVEWFCYGQEQTDYLERNLVGFRMALSCVEPFFAEQSRPECIEWEKL